MKKLLMLLCLVVVPLQGMDQPDGRTAEEIARDDADAAERAKQAQARFAEQKRLQQAQLAEQEAKEAKSGGHGLEEKKTAAAKKIPVYIPKMGQQPERVEEVDITANPDPITLETLEDEIDRQTALFNAGKPYDPVIVARTMPNGNAINAGDYPDYSDTPEEAKKKAERMQKKRAGTYANVPAQYYEAHSFNLAFFDYQRGATQGAGFYSEAELIGYPIILPWQRPMGYDLRRREYKDSRTNLPLVANVDTQYYVYDPAAPKKGFQYLCSYHEDGAVEGRLFNDVQGSPWRGYSQDYFLHYFYAHQNFDNTEGTYPADYKKYKKDALEWLKNYKPATHTSTAPAVTRAQPLPFLPIDRSALLEGQLAIARKAFAEGDCETAVGAATWVAQYATDVAEAKEKKRSAKKFLGALYTTGCPGFEKDFRLARRWYDSLQFDLVMAGLGESSEYDETEAALKAIKIAEEASKKGQEPRPALPTPGSQPEIKRRVSDVGRAPSAAEDEEVDIARAIALSIQEAEAAEQKKREQRPVSPEPATRPAAGASAVANASEQLMLLQHHLLALVR